MPYREDLDRTIDALAAYLEEAEGRNGPVLRQPPMRTLAVELGLDALMREGGLSGERLSAFLDAYLDNATRLQHPADMGHQVACPHPNAILGGFIDVFTNNPMAIYEMGASAATIEYAVLNFMLRKVGWQPAPYPGDPVDPDLPHGGGVLTHGGSLAQLTALATARAAADPQAWENGNDPSLVVIAPADAHYSVARALGILGLGQKALIKAPCDRQQRLQPQKLATLIEATRASGKRIVAVVANACCTAAGLYDPLDEIGAICNAAGVWLHVDGAHGASALLSDTHRHKLNGVERADSLIWDAHKLLRAPGLAAAVLVKDHRRLEHTFSQQASYLFHDKAHPGVDLLSRTVECTKAGLGLKLFMGLAAEGEGGLAGYIDSRFALAREAYDFINARSRFHCAVAPEANIVLFRLKGLDDAQQLQLRNRLVGAGESYITTTEFAGKRWLRLTFMNPATTLQDVEHVLHQLTAMAKEGG